MSVFVFLGRIWRSRILSWTFPSRSHGVSWSCWLFFSRCCLAWNLVSAGSLPHPPVSSLRGARKFVLPLLLSHPATHFVLYATSSKPVMPLESTWLTTAAIKARLSPPLPRKLLRALFNTRCLIFHRAISPSSRTTLSLRSGGSSRFTRYSEMRSADIPFILQKL